MSDMFESLPTTFDAIPTEPTAHWVKLNDRKMTVTYLEMNVGVIGMTAPGDTSASCAPSKALVVDFATWDLQETPGDWRENPLDFEWGDDTCACGGDKAFVCQIRKQMHPDKMFTWVRLFVWRGN